jgi:hypothetical protein
MPNVIARLRALALSRAVLLPLLSAVLLVPGAARAQPAFAERESRPVAIPGLPWGSSKADAVRALGARGLTTRSDLDWSSIVEFTGADNAEVSLTYCGAGAMNASMSGCGARAGLQTLDGTWRPRTQERADTLFAEYLDALIDHNGAPDAVWRGGKMVSVATLRGWRKWPAEERITAMWLRGSTEVTLHAARKPDAKLNTRLVLVQSRGPGNAPRAATGGR